MIKYIIIEGEMNKSQFQLWEHINKCIYNHSLVLIACSGIKNVLNVFKQVYLGLSQDNRDSSLFIIDIDNVVDNMRIIESFEEINSYIKYIDNAYILNTVCFEDTMLSFKLLNKWMFNSEGYTEKTVNKIRLLSEYNKWGIRWRASSRINKFIEIQNNHSRIQYLTTENVANQILTEITKGTNFYTPKSRLGSCFYINCGSDKCVYTSDKMKYTVMARRCGLWKCQLNESQKIQRVYNLSKIGRSLGVCKNYFIHKGYANNDIIIF